MTNFAKNIAAAALLAGTLFGASAGAAFAQGPGGGIAALDTNGDGALTREEANAGRMTMFARIDADSSGGLSSEEIDAAVAQAPGRGAMMGAMLRAADADGDGVVSSEEFLAAPSPMFDRLDANGDDVLDADELAAAQAHMGH